MKTEHTATPWRVDQEPNEKWPGIEAAKQSIVIWGTDDDDGGVRGETEEQALANARRIVACVNAMPEVEALLSAVQKDYGEPYVSTVNDVDWFDARDAFLAKLKESAL
jgi:hypothetical protein